MIELTVWSLQATLFFTTLFSSIDHEEFPDVKHIPLSAILFISIALGSSSPRCAELCSNNSNVFNDTIIISMEF